MKIRYITEITEDNIEYCKKMAQVTELRHLVLTNKYFEVTESGYMDAVRHDGHSYLPQQFDYVVYSSAKSLVNQQQAIFDRLWNMAIPCEQRFREMESEEMSKVDIIQDREHADLLLLSKVKNARSEIIGSVSSLTFLNHLVNAGLVDNMKEAKINGVSIFILCPPIPDYYKAGKRTVGSNYDGKSRSILDIEKYGEVRYASGAIEGSVFVFDDNEIIMISTDNEGVGRLLLSSRNRTLLRNYTSLFESFWNERETLLSIMRTKQSLMKSNAQLLSANEQLKVNDKLQKEFINIAAHELRTPVQPILGTIENIEMRSPILSQTDGEMTGTITKDELQILLRNIRRLEQLSNDILYAARIDSGILELNKAYFDLNVLIEDAIKQANRQIEELGKKAEINYQYKRDIIRILADEDKIRKVISNLLDNAIKFLGNNDGTISINLEVRSDGAPTVLISIKDSGTGMDKKIMPMLFTKFSSDTEKGGVGLGLYLSMKLVEAHGGKIWAENNADGKGATLFFTLPLG